MDLHPVSEIKEGELTKHELMKKLAIISTHPIQYNAPFFALLNKSDKIQAKVFYTWSQSQQELFDKDFGKTIKWDIPLLEGYDYEFIENTSDNPGLQSISHLLCVIPFVLLLNFSGQIL